MFGLGLPEFLMIVAIVIVLFGIRKLPNLSKDLGESGKEFKEGLTGKTEEVSLQELAKEVGNSARTIKEETRSIKETQV